MSAIDLVWMVLGLGLLAYGLTGGADYGGGVWFLFATGPRASDQRRAIDEALAPIWEANHVWLIFVIVVVFTVFPKAFAVIGIALHIPIALMLLGIIFRGAAFAFRAYGMLPPKARQRWSRVFAWASALTPVFLGMTAGALASGDIVVDGEQVTSGFVAGWTTPFAISVGVLTLALFALLAAVYLTIDAPAAVRQDFRARAMVTEAVAGATAMVALLLAWRDAPLFWANMVSATWFWPLQLGTAAMAIATLACLWTKRYRLARAFAAAQVSMVILGWGLGMDRHVILPAVSIDAAGAQSESVQAVLPVLAGGSLLLAPALWYLFRVFKGARAVGK